ncbi:MAG: hypothetical protein HYX60_01350 [Legionella longbeachae]|nr:hypothetical protein [Legionella longbeachae]
MFERKDNKISYSDMVKLKFYRNYLQVTFWKNNDNNVKEKLNKLENIDIFSFNPKKEIQPDGIFKFDEFLPNLKDKNFTTNYMFENDGQILDGLNMFTKEEECIHILLKLSTALENECRNNIHSYEYENILINGFWYPAIKSPESYKKTVKNHALRRVLIEQLEKQELFFGRVMQFYSIIPEKLFDQYMKERVYFTESSNGLIMFHGKHLHMLIYYLLSHFINDKNKLNSLIDELIEKGKWGDMFDDNTLQNCLNPYFLHSLILTHHKLKNSYLSMYIRDIFFNHSIKLKNTIVTGDISMKDFFEGINKNLQINILEPQIENQINNSLAEKNGITLNSNEQVEYFIIDKTSDNRNVINKKITFLNTHKYKENQKSSENLIDTCDKKFFGN